MGEQKTKVAPPTETRVNRKVKKGPSVGHTDSSNKLKLCFMYKTNTLMIVVGHGGHTSTIVHSDR